MVYPHCAGDSCMERFGSPSDRLTTATGGTGDCCLERPSSSSDEYITIRRLAGRRIGEVTWSGDRDTCCTGRGEDGGVGDRRLADALRVGEVEWSETNDMCCTDEEDNDGVGDRGLVSVKSMVNERVTTPATYAVQAAMTANDDWPMQYGHVDDERCLDYYATSVHCNAVLHGDVFECMVLIFTSMSYGCDITTFHTNKLFHELKAIF